MFRLQPGSSLSVTLVIGKRNSFAEENLRRLRAESLLAASAREVFVRVYEAGGDEAVGRINNG
jgi:hypothetical protein